LIPIVSLCEEANFILPLASSCEYALHLRVPLTERKLIDLAFQTNSMNKLAQTYTQEVPASNSAGASAFRNDVCLFFKLLPDKSAGECLKLGHSYFLPPTLLFIVH